MQMAKSSDAMADVEGKASLPGDSVDPATPAMAAHEEQFYSGLEAVKIINLPPDARFQRAQNHSGHGCYNGNQIPSDNVADASHCNVDKRLSCRA